MSLTKATYSMISGAVINILDYGAVAGADSTTAIQNALNACSNTGTRSVFVPGGNYIISATITIPEGVTLVGEGNRSAFSAGAEGYPSRFTKAASMTTAGIKLSGKRSRVENLGVYSTAGATGDGVWIAANYCSLVNVAANGHSVHGIRVGATAAGYLNCNFFYMNQVTASYNGQHGIIIDDQYSTYPLNDTNAGTLIQGEVRDNGDDGIFLGNCMWNTIQGCLAEGNTGYGLYIDTDSVKHTVISGDYDEVNTSGNIFNNGIYNTFIGILSSDITDGGSYTNIIGTTTCKLNQATIKDVVTVPRVSDTTFGSAVVVSNQAAVSNGRGVAIEFQTPDGVSAAPRSGVKLVGQNAFTANYDRFSVYVNDNGTMNPAFQVNPDIAARGAYPGADNSYSSGLSSNRWSVVYAATGTINTSDENQKQDIEELNESEKRVAVTLKGLIKKFRFKNAVESKGDNARIHVGVIAQDVKAAFEAEGLNADKYGVFCSDTLEDGSTILGVRYDELFAFIIGSL